MGMRSFLREALSIRVGVNGSAATGSSAIRPEPRLSAPAQSSSAGPAPDLSGSMPRRVLKVDEPQPRGPWHAVWFEHDAWQTWQRDWRSLCEMSSSRSIAVFVLTA